MVRPVTSRTGARGDLLAAAEVLLTPTGGEALVVGQALGDAGEEVRR